MKEEDVRCRVVTVNPNEYRRIRRANRVQLETMAFPRLCVHYCCPEAVAAIRLATAIFATSRPCSPTILQTKAIRKRIAPANRCVSSATIWRLLP